VQEIIFERFTKNLEAFGPFGDAPHFAVALSGGSDSSALLLLLHSWCRKNPGATITALTLDHQLRPESRTEAESVSVWCRSLGIDHVILTWDTLKPANRIQETARLARYQLLEKWCQDHGVLYLLTGHTLDDQEETFYMRLTKSASLKGLAGMSNKVVRPQVILLRPLGNFRKAELQDSMREHHHLWVEDPSNQNLKFLRPSLRGKMPDLRQVINPPLDILANHREHLEIWANGWLSQNVTLYPWGYGVLNKKAWQALPGFWGAVILENLVMTLGIGTYRPRSEALQGLHGVLGGERNVNRTLNGLKIRSLKNHISFEREYKKVTESIPVDTLSIFRWDNRFEVRPIVSMMGGQISALGLEGWESLIQHYPALKKLNVPKTSLMSTPALWQREKLTPEYSFVFQKFLSTQGIINYSFVPQYPLTRFIFSHF